MSRSRITKKQAKLLDASAVKAIADMELCKERLSNSIFRMAMMIDGKDDCKSLLEFAEKDSVDEFAINKIYNFIKKHKEERK